MVSLSSLFIYCMIKPGPSTKCSSLLVTPHDIYLKWGFYFPCTGSDKLMLIRSDKVGEAEIEYKEVQFLCIAMVHPNMYSYQS